MTIITQTNVDEESEELLRFREDWKQEVRRRRAEERQSSSDTVRAHHPSPSATNPVSPTPVTAEHKHVASGSLPRFTSPSQSISTPVHTSHGQSQLSKPLARAIEVYRSAVQHEQESQLDDALRLYRQAFRLDPHVDRAYFKEELRLQQTATSHPPSPPAHKKTLSTVDRAVERRDVPASHDKPQSVTVLTKFLPDFPHALSFEPEDERESVPINVVPDELLLNILRSLDITSIERFATVSRKARVLSLDSSIWRDFVYLTYRPPQIPHASMVPSIADNYATNYRQFYIEHPRLRLDGVYIAVCHYIRRGLSENAWVNISHLITYHRYLRFYPDGQVLSLLTNEELQPQIVIPMLKPSLGMKGFYIGDWRLDGSTVLISNLVEKHSPTLSSAHPPPTHTSSHVHHAAHVSQPNRYQFQMTLGLRSRPRGRWNKLDLVSYESVKLEDGEVMPLPLKHERPFWFSKVKSWAAF
ncbi:hypothetical protein F5I97DRAFT_1839250 [Phlebopus sp. FC_14]|nr:hypothetical protein F5I97DRAFT_1839250 [Phlebopus sp. FC_14]